MIHCISKAISTYETVLVYCLTKNIFATILLYKVSNQRFV